LAPEAPDPAAARRRALLEAAVAVFTRYGFRKTSMDEVARAAHLSRQGLYLHFATKEELFRAAVGHALESALQAAARVLRDGERELPDRLVGAFDEWVGRYVGMMGGGAADLVEAAAVLLGPVIAEYEGRFAELVARAISASRLAAAYRSAGLTARQLAETLAATARGLKHSSESREAFGRSMTVAVRALCAPLGSGR
jgi:AcrR family transcriptional regulator